jgi:branched-chain amino acid transport system substrate-binding protein
MTNPGSRKRRGERGAGTVMMGALVVLALALLVAGCWLLYELVTDHGKVTVYSSLPRYGPDGEDPQIEDMVNAMKLAVDQHNSEDHEFEVRYVALDDSTVAPGGFSAAATARNATRAAADDDTAGYIGEFNSGASAVSIPILSVAKVAQISPANTAVGLTSEGRPRGSADPSEPDTYYDRGYRNFARVVPKDSNQAEALLRLMSRDGCTRLAMINDGGYYGIRLAREVRLSTKTSSVRLVSDKTLGTRADRLPAVVAARRPDCFLYSGARDRHTVGLYTDVGTRLPDARLYAPDGLTETEFTSNLDPAIEGRIKMTLPARDRTDGLGTAFLRDYRAAYDGDTPEPYAVYAYEAMRLMLDAIERSGSGDRADVVTALLSTGSRRSAIGRYTLDENGDTDLRGYDVYGIRSGELRFLSSI